MRSMNRNRFFSFWHRFQQRFSRFLKVYLFFGRRRLCHCGTAGGHHRRGGRCRSLFFPFCHHHQLLHTFLLLPSPPLLSPSCFCFFFPFGRGYVVAVFFLPFAFRSLGGVLRVRWQRKKRKKKRHGKGEASRSDREPRKPVLLLLLFLFFLVSSSPFGFFFSLVVARVRPRKREGGALNEKGGE